MSKLTSFERETFEINCELLCSENIIVVSIKDLGLTIGLQYTNQRLISHVRVYVTQCGENDKFKFKRGVNELAMKYQNDNYIVIPALNRSVTEMLDVILNMYYNYVTIYDVQCRYLLEYSTL